MIARIWHGYTTQQNADAYETLLQEEIFIGIGNRKIEGLKDIQLLKRQMENETEFITIMWFYSIDAVKTFAGNDYEKAVIYEDAKPLLVRYDERSQHYEIKQSISA